MEQIQKMIQKMLSPKKEKKKTLNQIFYVEKGKGKKKGKK